MRPTADLKPSSPWMRLLDSRSQPIQDFQKSLAVSPDASVHPVWVTASGQLSRAKKKAYHSSQPEASITSDSRIFVAIPNIDSRREIRRWPPTEFANAPRWANSVGRTCFRCDTTFSRVAFRGAPLHRDRQDQNETTSRVLSRQKTVNHETSCFEASGGQRNWRHLVSFHCR